jgi:hypothetical protein
MAGIYLQSGIVSSNALPNLDCGIVAFGQGTFRTQQTNLPPKMKKKHLLQYVVGVFSSHFDILGKLE